VSLVRAPQYRRGGVGEGVLNPPTAPGRLLDLYGEAGLSRTNGTLHLDRVSLPQIADQIGTPVFVYNAEAIRERYRTLHSALAPLPHRICFALKANSNLAVLKILRELGAGVDIVSAGELARALAAGFAADKIVFSGVGKTRNELQAAVKAQIGHLNLESPEELELLGRVAEHERRRVHVGIRVNPDVTTDTHPYISTGKSGIKFGLPTDQVLPAAEYILRHPWLELTTLAMHLGSQIVDTEPFLQGIARLTELVRGVRSIGVDTLRVLDIGGGLGIRYAEERSIDPVDFAAAIIPRLAPTADPRPVSQALRRERIRRRRRRHE
jgi:diaminopimelate decarboxylase